MILAIFTAFWLGILTAISPCPMTTNIAAISFISKNIKTPSKAFLSGLLYTLGRILTYLILGFILISGLLTAPTVANFIQQHINNIFAPILILVGLFLLGVFRTRKCACNVERQKEAIENKYSAKFNKLMQKLGFLAPILLGVFFALSFCPISAALFFGSLSTLAIEHNSRFLLPLAYGMGTGLPVVVFAIAIVFSIHKVGEIYNSLVKFEFWFKKITGIIFIVAGIYFVITYYL